jgi:hypothetical protein
MAQSRPSYENAAQNGLLEQADSGRSALLRQEKVRARREKAQANNISLAETVAVPATRQPELSDSGVDEFGRLQLANNEANAPDLDQELVSDEELDEEDEEENDYDEDEVDGDEYDEEEDDTEEDGYDDSSTAARLRSAKRFAARATGPDKVTAESNGLIKDGFSAGTDFLLRQSWYNIIDSFGATLIWINCHIFLRFVVGEDYFKKLGHEWETMGAAKLETAVAGAEAKEALRLAGDRIGLGETMLVILLDLIVLFALLWFFVQVVLVVALITKLGDTALQALTGPFVAIVDTINLFLGNK